MTGICVLSILLFGFLLRSEIETKEISSDLKQLVDQVRPAFEENLIRAFRNEAVRNQQRANKNGFIHKLDNILLSLDDTKITRDISELMPELNHIEELLCPNVGRVENAMATELSHLKFPWIPDFRIITMSVDLSMLCIDVSFKLGDLRVEGDYEANSMALQNLLPVSNNGKIEVTFSDVTAKGRVGLLIKGDSLVPENYDIRYEPVETVTSVKYYISNENEIENKVVKSNGEYSIGDYIWVQLNDTLTHLLHRQLGEAVVEFSLTELLVDEDEQLRDLAREHSQRANKLLDSLLWTAKDYLVDKNYRSIETPSFDVVYRGKLSGLYQGRLRTGSGYIQDLSTLSRLQDLSLYEDRRTLVVYGSLGLRELKHGYEKYTSQFEETAIEGNIKTTVYRNKIFVKLSVLKEGERCKTQLDDVQVSTVKDIDVDASGLASLSWLAPKLQSWVIGNLRYSALPVLQNYIKEAFNYAIEKTDCVSLIAD